MNRYKIIGIISILCLIALAHFTSRADVKTTQDIQNINFNWTYTHADSLKIETDTTTVVLTGRGYGQYVHHATLEAVDADILYKLSYDSGRWPDWMTLSSGSSIRFDGGNIDTVFAKVSADSAHLQLYWTVY